MSRHGMVAIISRSAATYAVVAVALVVLAILGAAGAKTDDAKLLSAIVRVVF